jgi:hypothetical protein
VQNLSEPFVIPPPSLDTPLRIHWVGNPPHLPEGDYPGPINSPVFGTQKPHAPQNATA